METETIDKLFLELSQVTTATTETEKRRTNQNAMLSRHVAALTNRVADLLDLLTSARCIAERKGVDVAWERFSERLRLEGAGSITPKTFRVLAGDLDESNARNPSAPL